VFCYSSSQPLGVVGLISPWNFPVAIPVWKLAPLCSRQQLHSQAVAAHALTATALIRGLEEAGVPPGVCKSCAWRQRAGIELIST